MAKIRLIRTIREYADVVTYEFDNPGVSFQAGQYGHLMVGWPWQGSAVPSGATVTFELFPSIPNEVPVAPPAVAVLSLVRWMAPGPRRN